MTNDGYISPKLYIHKSIWKTDRGVIKCIIKKNKYMSDLIEELRKLRNQYEKSPLCYKEMELFISSIKGMINNIQIDIPIVLKQEQSTWAALGDKIKNIMRNSPNDSPVEFEKYCKYIQEMHNCTAFITGMAIIRKSSNG